MTAEDRVEECVSDGGEQQPEVEQAEEKKGEEVNEGQGFAIVDSVITAKTVFEQDGKVCHDEVEAKQTFASEEPEPYGPDESLQVGKEGDEECGFCLFMKAGPCGKRFASWEACVDDAETTGINIVEKCAQKTHFLKECMETHPEYYGPVLQAEKAIDEQSAMVASKKGGEDNPNLMT
ncbi:hypothetical protein KC19_VG213300 [Ceratodon purpureus]|uniref:GCK domain-containing protein n=1 Tax=Ceratodon purpureus TaxID=3225 RepID=A0A8T0HTJ1_CERPU|nr:hypothetical protein KC19_VG213300 [Ceratodon purpureus]